VTDNVYPALEQSERELAGDLRAGASVGAVPNGNGHASNSGTSTPRAWQVPKDEDRVPRTMEEMEKEAKWLNQLLKEAGVA